MAAAAAATTVAVPSVVPPFILATGTWLPPIGENADARSVFTQARDAHWSRDAHVLPEYRDIDTALGALPERMPPGLYDTPGSVNVRLQQHEFDIMIDRARLKGNEDWITWVGVLATLTCLAPEDSAMLVLGTAGTDGTALRTLQGQLGMLVRQATRPTAEISFAWEKVGSSTAAALVGAVVALAKAPRHGLVTAHMGTVVEDTNTREGRDPGGSDGGADRSRPSHGTMHALRKMALAQTQSPAIMTSQCRWHMACGVLSILDTGYDIAPWSRERQRLLAAESAVARADSLYLPMVVPPLVPPTPPTPVAVALALAARERLPCFVTLDADDPRPHDPQDALQGRLRYLFSQATIHAATLVVVVYSTSTNNTGSATARVRWLDGLVRALGASNQPGVGVVAMERCSPQETLQLHACLSRLWYAPRFFSEPAWKLYSLARAWVLPVRAADQPAVLQQRQDFMATIAYVMASVYAVETCVPTEVLPPAITHELQRELLPSEQREQREQRAPSQRAWEPPWHAGMSTAPAARGGETAARGGETAARGGETAANRVSRLRKAREEREREAAAAAKRTG